MYKKASSQYARILLVSQLTIFLVLNFPTESKPVRLGSFLPRELKTLGSELIQKDFLITHPKAILSQASANGQPSKYLEEHNSRNINSVEYYFETESPSSQLSKMVIHFNTVDQMELQANILLGESNIANKNITSYQWKFKLKEEDITLHCFASENQIIYNLAKEK